MKVGFIGLGIMGAPVAMNILKDGHRPGAPAVSSGADGVRVTIADVLLCRCADNGTTGAGHASRARSRPSLRLC